MGLLLLIRAKEKATPGLPGGTGREGDTDRVFSSRGQPLRRGGAILNKARPFFDWWSVVSTRTVRSSSF